MFDSISNHLSKIFNNISGQKLISNSDIEQAIREIRIALLEADVSLPIAKEFISQVKEKIIGQKVISSVKASDMIIKIVSDELILLLQSESNNEINLSVNEPIVILMAGLQASGKTTTSAKLAYYLKNRKKKNKILLASLDTKRPAAMEQLAILGDKAGVDNLEIIKGQSAIDIAKRALDIAKSKSYEVLILDTAGRTNIDIELMSELSEIQKITNPQESILIVDAMMGQDGINIANDFKKEIDITSVILTRIDGNSRGGVAITMKKATNCPIKFLGSGEKIDQLEVFDPERIASRILGMGDIVSLVEKTQYKIEKDDMDQAEKSLREGNFNFEDLLKQIKNMRRMGGVASIISFLPGAGKIREMMNNSNLEKETKKQEALILSMTLFERRNPYILNSSRKRRIASGSGYTIQEVNRLIKKIKQMQKMVKKVGKMDKNELEKMTSDGGLDKIRDLLGKK